MVAPSCCTPCHLHTNSLLYPIPTPSTSSCCTPSHLHTNLLPTPLVIPHTMGYNKRGSPYHHLLAVYLMPSVYQLPAVYHLYTNYITTQIHTNSIYPFFENAPYINLQIAHIVLLAESTFSTHPLKTFSSHLWMTLCWSADRSGWEAGTTIS